MSGFFDETMQPSVEEGMEINQEIQEQIAQKQREILDLIHEVFSKGRGPEFLELLSGATVEQSPLLLNSVQGLFFRGAEIPMNPSEWMFYREGQNSIYRGIMAAMDQRLSLIAQEGQND